MLDENQPFLNQLIAHPKRVFLLDALGALLTTLLLAGVIAQFEGYFGMPKQIVYLLSTIAFSFFIYSL